MVPLIVSAVLAATASFTTDGTAVVVGGNRAEAVAQATKNGEVQAVEKALEKLGVDTAEAQELVDTHCSEIIKSSQVSRDSVDGNILSLKATVVVDLAALQKITGASGLAKKAALGGKKVIILATEQVGPKDIVAWTDYAFGFGPGSVSASSKTHLIQLVDESGSLEATLSDAFASAGFEVIDVKTLKGKLSKPGVDVVDLSTPQAQAIALKGDADLVIVAKGKADLMYHPALAEAGMQSGSGNVVARLIRVKDGKVLSSSTQQAAKVHLDVQTARILALNEAAKLASAELIRKLNAD